MKFTDWIKGKMEEDGVEFDESELAALGLSEGSSAVETPSGNVMLDELAGTASAASELFLGETGLDASEVKFDDETGLIWAPIIREGQFAVRPGPAGQKRRVPLKIIAGHSKNARKEIGLADLLAAHKDGAVQHVTVPTSHANTLLENQGFVVDMKIVKGKVTRKDGVALSEPETVSVLMGGYKITEPETKGKMERGTIANRSAGILYDYCATETGKVYPAVVEHVALTNKPWITGMASFFRKLASASKPAPKPIALSLSDVGPTEDELIEYEILSEGDTPQDWFDEDGDGSSSTTTSTTADATGWSSTGSPEWLRSRANRQLREARYEKIQKAQATKNKVEYDPERPYYHAIEAKPGAALVASDHGDQADHWHAPMDEKGELSPFKDWTKIQRSFVEDPDRPDPKKEHEPLSQDGVVVPVVEKPKLSRLQLAQQARKQRAGQADITDNPDTPRGGAMSGTKNEDQLSEAARADMAALRAELEAEKAKNANFSERFDRLSGTIRQSEVDKYIDFLKKPIDDGGLGLSEDKGFGGALTVIRDLMLADDGEPAVEGEAFSTDSNKDGSLSLSESLKLIFSAFAKVKEGGTALSEQTGAPTEVVDAGADKGKAAKDDATALSQGKPATREAEPDKKDKEKSQDELLSEVEAEAGTDFFQMAGIKRPAATAGKGA